MVGREYKRKMKTIVTMAMVKWRDETPSDQGG